MRGLYLEAGELSYREDLPEPDPALGDVEVQVLRAGVCATDLALRRGYMGFRGVPGHEFVGIAKTGSLAGQRVVGDINAACGHCVECNAGDPHHCRNRTVLGILGHSGAFAERLRLPAVNLLAVPDSVSTDAATFVEPLAAALEIEEQLQEVCGQRILVAGDGRLGLLCAWALHLAGADLTVAGRHADRSQLLPGGVRHVTGWLEANGQPESGFDVAVEATGSAPVLSRLFGVVRPRGAIVMKTTLETAASIDLSPLVIDELRLIGSRCGPFDRALTLLAQGAVPVERLIAERFPLAEGPAALDRAAAGGVLKVLVEV